LLLEGKRCEGKGERAWLVLKKTVALVAASDIFAPVADTMENMAYVTLIGQRHFAPCSINKLLTIPYVVVFKI
jgi:hypothetical protein